MSSSLNRSLDSLANLIYLIRISLDEPEKAALYVGFAEDEINEIRRNASPCVVVPFLLDGNGQADVGDKPVLDKKGA